MRFRLFDYQEVAADAIVRALRRGARDYMEEQEYTAINFTAPTAAGKTVVATAVVERLFTGDDTGPGDPDATVLWVTDDPSLNEQTRRKMAMAASKVTASQLVTIDAAFDQETFDRSKVYFLNIQKLGRATGYVKGGVDRRTYSLWTTLRRTVEERGGHFVVVIDEAHRGAGVNRERPTIVGRIISDPDGAVPPMPIVWGISATPERFEDAIARAVPSRTVKPVKVPIEDVRESGLIKDKVRIQHKAETQRGDATLSQLAVEDLRRFDECWNTYAEKEEEPRVRPVLAVQVKAKASESDLAELLAALREGWAELAGTAVAHTFESHTSLNVGGQVVRYIAPQDIEDDVDARVVLFKEALTTGWDCPRAEVMLSFRRAEDFTYIAQLIGRMVRTPLARRVMTDERLNSVSLYLPYYDEKAVSEVVERLRNDPDAPPTVFERNAVECAFNPAVPKAVVECLRGVPTYIVPGRAHRSQVARLHLLATRLAGDGVDEDAIDVADQHLIDTVDREQRRLAADGTLERVVEALAVMEYGVVEVSLLDDDIRAAVQSATTHVRNIDDLLKDAGRGLRDGLAKIYWGRLVESGEDATRAKLITSALASDSSVVAAVEAAAEQLVQAWLKEHSRAIAGLSEARKSAYYAVRAQARESERVDVVLPAQVTASGEDPTWERHIYANAAGQFHAAFTTWEEEVLQAELNPDQGLIGWYRNPAGGERAVRVPYATTDGYERPMYPDFIFFHEGPSGIVVSIVDPHNYALADVGPKWRGLGKYAELHGEGFCRIDAVIKDPEGVLLRLDLKDATVRKALQHCHDKDDILKVFREHGGTYS